MQVAGYGNKGFYSASAVRAYGQESTVGSAAKAGENGKSGAATVVTLSQEAMAAGTEPDFAQIVQTARETLNRLLTEAERRSPLEGGRLALDMSALSQRELFAIAKTDDGLFTSDERKAAALELGRRFDLALSGPAAVSEVTGDYRTLYKAAAAYLDGQSAEQKADPGWQEARAAIGKALTALQADHGTPPAGIAGDPVATFLADQAATDSETPAEDATSLAESLRKVLDKRYAAGKGLSGTGERIDLGEFDSRSISAMALNRDGLFSSEEVRAAETEIRSRANTALTEGYKEAARSGDPTAFSRNIIAIYSSMSAEERLASGLSENLLNTAVANYESTTRLMNMMAQGMSGMGGMQSWF